MLIDWLPQALKRFPGLARKLSTVRAKRPVCPLTFQVENLEERQLLSATNSFLPSDLIDPVLMQMATGGHSSSTITTSTSASSPVTNGASSGNFTPPPTSGGQTGTGTITNLSSTFVTKDQLGRVGVRIISSNVTALQSSLQSLGFATTSSRPDLNFVEGFIPQSKIPQLGNLAALGLRGVVPMLKPLTNAGPTVDQGGATIGSDRVLGTLPPGYDGTGVTIGILSDSFNSNGAQLPAMKNGDLPSSVNVLQDGVYLDTDEGRGMAELVHDTAPGASIAFASGEFGQASMAQQIRNLANPAIGNADVIVDDLRYPDEPMFQDGVIAQAVNDVVNFNGVSYFSSAGNYASSSYEVTNPTFATDPQLGAGYLDFDSSSIIDTRNEIFLFGGESIQLELQWDDPFYTTNGVDTDIDIYAVDPTTGEILASSTSNNIATQTPSEFLALGLGGFGFAAVDIVVKLESGPAPKHLKWVDYGDHFDTFTHDTASSTIYGHAAASNAMSVGAVPYYDPFGPESFTSAGNTTILFTPTGSPLGAPDVRQTPSIASVDGTNTSFFTGNFLFVQGGDVEDDGLPNFFGTSAAAPHAAAVAALIKQANPGMTPQQIYTRMIDTATDVGDFGVDNLTGAGLVNAYAAIFGEPIQAGLDFQDSFESSALSNNWDTQIIGNGLLTLGGAKGATDGSSALTLGSRFEASNLTNFPAVFDGLAQATLHLDLSGATDDVFLSFDAKEQNGPSLLSGASGEDPMSDFFFNNENSDGVAISVDGGTVWRKIVSLTGPQISQAFQHHKINLTELAANNGFGLGSDVQIRFQAYDFFFVPNPITVDNVQLFTNQPVKVTLNATPLVYPLNSPPKFLDENATIEDNQTPVYDGGSLVIAITQNATSSDRIEILNEATLPNHVATPTDISIVGNRVLYGGLQIGTFIGGSGVSPLTVTLNTNATVAAVNALLQDITFRSSSSSLLPRKVAVTVDNGTGTGGTTVTRTINVVAAANVAPTITMTPTVLLVQPGATAAVIDGSALVNDPDSANFDKGVLTIKITNNASTLYDRIEIRNQGNSAGQISFSGTTIKYGGTTIGTLSGGTTDRTITLNAAATPAAVQALLQNVTFRSTSTSAPLATRTVQFKLTDGDGGTSLVASKLINVVKRNQSPVVSGTTTIPTYFLGKTAVVIEPSGSVNDADSTNFAGGKLTVSVTTNGTAFDRLSVRNQGSNVGQIAVSGGSNILYGGILIGTLSGGNGSANPLVINLNANATPAAVRALMRNITFQTAGTVPSLKQRTITMQVADGQGGVSNVLTKFVKVSK